MLLLFSSVTNFVRRHDCGPTFIDMGERRPSMEISWGYWRCTTTTRVWVEKCRFAFLDRPCLLVAQLYYIQQQLLHLFFNSVLEQNAKNFLRVKNFKITCKYWHSSSVRNYESDSLQSLLPSFHIDSKYVDKCNVLARSIFLLKELP